MTPTRIAPALITAALALACAGGDDALTPALDAPTPAPDASEAAADLPDPPQAIDRAGTHCAADEIAWFRCTAPGDEVLSLCSTKPFSADAGALYYRFGPLGAPELTYPAAPVAFARAFAYESRDVPGGMGQPVPFTRGALSFENEGVGYVIETVLSGDATTRIMVHPPGGEAVELPCTDASGEIFSLEAPTGWVPPM